MTVRFKDGSIATDRELECVALAFGFSSWMHMRREFMAGDIRRDGASRHQADRIATEEVARQMSSEAYQERSARERKEKDAQRKANQRAARLAVVERKRAEAAAGVTA